MQEENFLEDEISQHVAVIHLPSLGNSRRHNHTFHEELSEEATPRVLKENHPPSNTINRLLYGGKESDELRKPSRHLTDNMEKQKQLKERKLNDLHQELEGRRLADCTFKPKTNVRPESTRSLEEFLESQYRFAQKVLEKKQRLKDELDEGRKDETFRPKLISNTSGRMTKQPVHQRLYNLRQKEQEEEPLHERNQFRPTITAKGRNMVREGRVELNLYQDALRRQEKQKGLAVAPPTPDKYPSTNLMTEKYVAQKFIKEYYLALEEMNIQDFSGTLEYIIFNELLFRLGFVISAKEVENRASSNQRSLVYEAYRLLEKHGVTVRNICVFLLGLLGVYHINPTNFDGSNGASDDDFSLNEVDGRKLQKHFDLLYRNRLSAEELKKTPGVEEYSFKPVINAGSSAMAENYRNKMLEQTTMLIESHDLPVDIPEDGLISHADLLILNKLGKEKEKERKKNDIAQQQLRQCTFKPAIIGDMRNRSMVCVGEDDDYEGRKHEQLYNLSKAGKRLQKHMPSKLEEVAAEEDRECTFQPKINKKRQNGPKPEPISGRDVQKSMLRMLEGRKQRELKNRYLTRGYLPSKDASLNHSHNSSSHRDVPKQEELPFLVIDVNLGDQTEQIVVYKDEIDQPEMLAQQFAIKHGLEPESRQKLLQLLRQQINNILQKIDEQEQQQRHLH